MLNAGDAAYLRQTLSFFEMLSSGEQDYLLAHASAVRYHAGQSLYGPAYQCMGMFLIKNGGLRTYLLSDDGRDITLYRLSAGDVCVLSASCILKNITFDVHIDAEQDTDLYMVESAAVSELIAGNMAVENYVLRTAADRFSDVMWAMEQLLFMKIDGRLAAFLLDESNKSGLDTLFFTHEQIAKYIGSAREVVSRMLKQVEREGLVSVSRGRITLLDKKHLRDLTT